jgi:hypothetical protein
VEKNLIQDLESSVKLDLDPARRLLDGLSVVVGTPAFDKG